MVGLAIIFNILLLASCVYSIRYGGGYARSACLMMIVAVLATRVVTGWTHDQWPLAAVDCLLLLGFLRIAFMADRFWPMWVTGLQSTSVAAHVAVALSPPSIGFKLMAAVTSVWSPFILLMMALGICLDHRANLGRQ